jgi:hypothetical protein
MGIHTSEVGMSVKLVPRLCCLKTILRFVACMHERQRSGIVPGKHDFMLIIARQLHKHCRTLAALVKFLTGYVFYAKRRLG